jgi:DnaJ-class molecular chaperone
MFGCSSSPFVSETAEYVFYLTKLDGKQRNDALGITDEVYEDKVQARIWYEKIAEKVHPDKGGSEHAFKVLNEIYDVLTNWD